MTLYLKTTSDEYRLPIAVASSVAELCRMTGQTLNSVSSCISKARKRENKEFMCWCVVEVEDD